MQSLRTRLFAAIALVALLSLALALALGAILTRRAVERNTLRDVSAQFDLLVEREREALVPFARLKSLQEFLDRQDERVVQVPLDGSSSLLPPDRAALLRRGARLDGTLQENGTRYLYAARLVNGKGFILLRPASSTTSAWRPHIEGLDRRGGRDCGSGRTDRVPARARDRTAGPARRGGDPRPRRSRSAAAARFRSRGLASWRSSPRASTRSPSRSPGRARRSRRSCSRSATS